MLTQRSSRASKTRQCLEADYRTKYRSLVTHASYPGQYRAVKDPKESDWELLKRLRRFLWFQEAAHWRSIEVVPEKFNTSDLFTKLIDMDSMGRYLEEMIAERAAKRSEAWPATQSPGG